MIATLLYVIIILHQTATKSRVRNDEDLLYVIIILHQTATMLLSYP